MMESITLQTGKAHNQVHQFATAFGLRRTASCVGRRCARRYAAI
jgi:hypothetical protein